MTEKELKTLLMLLNYDIRYDITLSNLPSKFKGAELKWKAKRKFTYIYVMDRDPLVIIVTNMGHYNEYSLDTIEKQICLMY